VETDQQAALELSRGLEPTASNIGRVSAKTSPEAARWAFTQWELRKKAVKKGFPKAEEMLFTREALEQASHFAVARYHASLFPTGELVADLTCGIGSDLIALAERGPVVGFDIDAERLEYARHNLSVHGLKGELVLDDPLERDWTFEYAFADPSRRVAGRRTLDLSEFSPSPHRLSERLAQIKFGAIKLSPMIPDGAMDCLGSRLAFVSYNRECREALVCRGKDAIADKFAERIETRAKLRPSNQPTSIDDPLQFLYEADPAAIRVHALSAISNDLHGLGDSNGYLTSESEVESEWLTRFRVLDFGHFDQKSLRARLGELGGGIPVVKSRIPGLDVAKFPRAFKAEGRRTLIVVLYLVAMARRYAIVESHGSKS
jgi:SAM-dependent methyltransferase